MSEYYIPLTWALSGVMKRITTQYRHSNVMSKGAESRSKGLIFFNVIWRGSMYFFRAITVDSHVLMMAIRHNAPVESPFGPSQYVQGSISESSVHGGSPAQGSVIRSSLGQTHSLPSQAIPNHSEAMSIGSMSEPTMCHDYASAAIQNYVDFAHLSAPAAPLMPSDFMYGNPASDSPYLSSDSSSYSPRSDLIQPQLSTQSFQLTGDLPRAQSASLDSTFPQQIYTLPLIDTSPITSWSFDQSPPMHSPMQSSMLPSVCGTIFSLLFELINSTAEPTFSL